MHTKQVPTKLGCHYGVGELYGGVPYPFPPFQSLFKLP